MTGDKSARMEWKHYWQNIVKQYQVIIEGWPDNLPFCNLSETSNSLSDLETLYRKWCCSGIYWKKLSSQELQDLDLQHDYQIEQGEAEAPAPQCHHSDFGKKCSQSNGTGSSTQKKHKKSRKVISDEESSEEDREKDSDKEDPDGEAARTQKRHCKPTLHGISSPYGFFVCYQLTLTVVFSLIFHVLSMPNMTVITHCTLPSHHLIDHINLALLMVHAIPLQLTSSDDGGAYLLEIEDSI
jgi:hypothetical protein